MRRFQNLSTIRQRAAELTHEYGVPMKYRMMYVDAFTDAATAIPSSFTREDCERALSFNLAQAAQKKPRSEAAFRHGARIAGIRYVLETRAPREDELKRAGQKANSKQGKGAHMFKGNNPKSCGTCSLPMSNKVHKDSWGKRSDESMAKVSGPKAGKKECPECKGLNMPDATHCQQCGILFIMAPGPKSDESASGA